MTHAIPGDRLLARAFLASLALHLLLLALIPPLVANNGSQTVETLSFVRIVRVAIHRPAQRPAPVVAAAAPKFAPVVRAVPIRARAQHRTPQRAVTRKAAPAPRAPVVAEAVRAGSNASTIKAQRSTTAVASSTPAQPPTDTAVPKRQSIGGLMPLGVDEPVPVLEPSVHQALIALGVHVTLTVTVDALGKTKAVAFAPPLDAASEEKIRAMLADASWDPAVCGAGTACEADATIRL